MLRLMHARPVSSRQVRERLAAQWLQHAPSASGATFRNACGTHAYIWSWMRLGYIPTYPYTYGHGCGWARIVPDTDSRFKSGFTRLTCVVALGRLGVRPAAPGMESDVQHTDETIRKDSLAAVRVEAIRFPTDGFMYQCGDAPVQVGAQSHVCGNRDA